jgi:hypothetical protein
MRKVMSLLNERRAAGAAVAAFAIAALALGFAALLAAPSAHMTRPHPPSPAIVTTPVRPANPADASDPTPEQVAAAFTAAFLTFRWDGPADQVRRRCRPWDTDEVDAALAGPGLPPDRDRRAARGETDDVTIHAVNPQDRAVDHMDASVAALVRRDRPGQTAQMTTEFVDVRVVATAAGWVVAQVSQ